MSVGARPSLNASRCSSFRRSRNISVSHVHRTVRWVLSLCNGGMMGVSVWVCASENATPAYKPTYSRHTYFAETHELGGHKVLQRRFLAGVDELERDFFKWHGGMGENGRRPLRTQRAHRLNMLPVGGTRHTAPRHTHMEIGVLEQVVGFRHPHFFALVFRLITRQGQ